MKCSVRSADHICPPRWVQIERGKSGEKEETEIIEVIFKKWGQAYRTHTHA